MRKLKQKIKKKSPVIVKNCWTFLFYCVILDMSKEEKGTAEKLEKTENVSEIHCFRQRK